MCTQFDVLKMITIIFQSKSTAYCNIEAIHRKDHIRHIAEDKKTTHYTDHINLRTLKNI